MMKEYENTEKLGGLKKGEGGVEDGINQDFAILAATNGETQRKIHHTLLRFCMQG